MNVRGGRTAAVLLALLAPAGAGAQDLKGSFTVAFQAGTQSELAGDLLKGASGSLLGKATTIDSLRYRDVYNPDLRLQGLLGYGVGERVELVARVSWYEADAAQGLEAGARDGKPVYAYFDPSEEVGFEVGVRFYISASGRLKSYVAPVAGVRFQSEVLVSFSVPEAGSALLNLPFSQESTVAVFGLDVGFTFDLTPHVFLGVDTGLRYQTAPSPFEGLEGLPGIEDGDGRWSAPVVASLGVRF
jgi:hypothetical protein